MRALRKPTTGLLRLLGVKDAGAADHAWIVGAAGLIALLAMVVRVVFWLYTHRYWEDALITCLHAENFALGHGLTHVRPGEPPLHGFTSPLSVLIPLMADLVHVGWGVDFLKLVSLPCAALTVLYVLAIGIHPKVRLPAPLILLAMGYAAFEHQQILWGMAGMETQVAEVILLASIYYCIAWKPIPLGISLGLCMLARPDYAFWTVIVGVYGIFRERWWQWKKPLEHARRLPLIVGTALMVYLPWIGFCLLHYGSPIPNTVVAKGLGYTHWYDKVDVINFAAVKRHTWMMMAEQLHLLLGPTFAGHGAGLHVFFTNGPESPIGNVMFVFCVIGTLAILIRRQYALWPLAACAVVYSLYYVYLVPVVFGWYKVPYIMLVLLLSVRGLQTCTAWIPGANFRWGFQAAVAVAYLAPFLVVLPITFQTERQIQEHVENDIRKQAGLYLQEHMARDEAVGCEPLGYMSYYSRGNVYDWPGLASRTVVAWSKENEGRRSLENMLKDLQPEYLFLRDMEILYWFQDSKWFQDHYHVAETFLIDPEAAKNIRWIDRNIDTRFRIYKKNTPGEEYDYSNWPTEAAYHGAGEDAPRSWGQS
jgi:hypothetical protein